MARKTSADIRAEIADLTSSAQALLDIAKDQDRELDADELESFNGYSERLETAKADLAKAEEFEARKRQIAEMQSLNSAPASPIGGIPTRGSNDVLRVHHRIGPMRAFKGDSSARDAYDCGMWLRAMLARNNRQTDEQAEARIATRGWDVRATATEGTATAGGFLVPTPLANAIIDVRALAGISRQLARVVPMTAETLQIARKTDGTTVYYPGETGTTTASDQSWGQVELRAKKRAILSKISQELRDDALIAVVDDLASQMGTDFAVKEDAEFVKGDTTSTYGGEKGLLESLGAAGLFTPSTGAGKSVWTGLALTDFTSTMGKLPDKYWQYGPSWICSSVFYYTVMFDLMADAGGNTIATIANGASGRPNFLGYPVYFTNQMPTATAVSTTSALFGAFNQAAVIGDRMGIMVAQSEHLDFAEELLAVRATTRYDINVYDHGDGSTAGAYVGLSTAAS